MKVYCALTGGLLIKLLRNPKYKIPKFNILDSFFFGRNIEDYVPYAKSILIDSGAYSLQQSVTRKYDDYFKEYRKYIELHSSYDIIEGFFEFDVDRILGYDKVLDYREELFEITDKIIPVWHKDTGISEFKRMVNEYDFIGIPCTQHANIKKNSIYKFVNYAHNNNCRIHGLGMLSSSILNKIPFDTVDGTGWMRCTRFGRLNKRKVDSDYIRNNGQELTYIELINHIKFQEKMYKKWRRYHND